MGRDGENAEIKEAENVSCLKESITVMNSCSCRDMNEPKGGKGNKHAG